MGRYFAGVAQLVERKPSKLDVAGSSPVSRSGTQDAGGGSHVVEKGRCGRREGVAACASPGSQDEERFAHVAQLVEHTLGKGEVIGSIPIVSSAGR